MFEQTRRVFNGDNRGLPNFLLSRAGNYNALWGSNYIVFVCGVPGESEIDGLIEDLLLYRKLELQQFYL